MVKSQPNLPEDMVLSGFGDRRWQLLLAVLVIIFTGLLVFSKLPLQLWDESRQAVNSL
jgi:hypothetical protein